MGNIEGSSTWRKIGLERNVFFIGVSSFLTDTTTKMIYAVMPMFLLSIGATKTELSLIEGIAESTASVIKALSGWWSDKIRKNRPFMIVGYAFTAVLSPLFSLVTTPFQVLLIRFAERIGKGIRTAPRDSLIAASSSEATKGRSFGFHKAMDNSGAIIGPIFASCLLFLFPRDYRLVFIIAAIPGLLGLLFMIRFVKEAANTHKEPLGKVKFKDFSKRYYFFLGIVFLFTLGNSTDALLLVKAGDVGVSEAFIPMLYLVFNAVSVLFAVPAGSLSDKIGRERIILFGYILYALIYFGFGQAGSPSAMVLLFIFYGVYSAATDGVQKALVSDLIDARLRGTGMGIYNSLVGMTLLPASVIAGVLYDHLGSSAPFYFGAFLAMMAAIFMLIFYRKSNV